MSLKDIVDFFRREKDTPDQVFALADPDADPGSAVYDKDTGAYFQIRLSEMYLTDKRRWHREVAPATFVYTDFQYGGQSVRRPFFVSNALLPEIPLGVEPKTLRVRFANTSVLGPVPYAGGDVDLFVGLFQTTLVDWRQMTFQVLEKIFGVIGPNPVSAYLDKINTLAGDLLAFLGRGDVTCMLAQRQPLGQHAIPAAGYIAYLRHSEKQIPMEDLQVHEGKLKRKMNGDLHDFDETDYCLIQVQRLESRNDDASMPFHALWKEARQKALAADTVGAQALMLDCAQQILASSDLTEGDKTRLIAKYQKKLHEAKNLLDPAEAPHGAERAGTEEIITTLSQRAAAAAANDFHAEDIKAAYKYLTQVATEPGQQAAWPGKLPRAETLVRALTLGSLAPAPPPRAV